LLAPVPASSAYAADDCPPTRVDLFWMRARDRQIALLAICGTSSSTTQDAQQFLLLDGLGAIARPSRHQKS